MCWVWQLAMVTSDYLSVVGWYRHFLAGVSYPNNHIKRKPRTLRVRCRSTGAATPEAWDFSTASASARTTRTWRWIQQSQPPCNRMKMHVNNWKGNVTCIMNQNNNIQQYTLYIYIYMHMYTRYKYIQILSYIVCVNCTHTPYVQWPTLTLDPFPRRLVISGSESRAIAPRPPGCFAWQVVTCRNRAIKNELLKNGTSSWWLKHKKGSNISIAVYNMAFEQLLILFHHRGSMRETPAASTGSKPIKPSRKRKD